MSSAKLTLIGFYNYDETLFDNLAVPEGIDKDTLVSNILLRGGEFEVLYSNPNFMKKAIGVWATKWQRTMDKWVKALAIDYEPLSNYDRHEITTETPTGTTTTKVENTPMDNPGEQTTNAKGSAYDSDAEVNLGTTTVVDTTRRQTESTVSFDDYVNTRDSRISGNIGVTTSQQMLQSELDISAWNVYEHITDLFLQEFILPIY